VTVGGPDPTSPLARRGGGILTDAVSEPAAPRSLADAIRAVAVRHGGVDLERPQRRRQRPIDLG
jgi:hypothetical protein